MHRACAELCRGLVQTPPKGAMRRIQRFIDMAAEVARDSPMRFKHGAVLVKFGRKIGMGYNQARSCFKGYGVTSMHAEIQALKGKALGTTSGSDLYVVRLGEAGLANSKPCLDCLRVIKQFGVKKVVYSTKTNGIVIEKVKNMIGYNNSMYKPTYAYSKPLLKPVRS